MILFPYFELAASLLILLFSFSIFTRHYENRAARFFARLALLAFVITIFEYSARIAFTLDLAQTIYHLSGALWGFLFPVFTHFCLIFARRDKILKNQLTYILLYTPAVALALLHLFTNLLYVRYEIYPFGIANQPSDLYWFFTANTIVYILWGIAILLDHAIASPQKSVRYQSLMIAVGTLIPGTIGVTTDELMPLLMGYRFFPPMCVFSVAFMMLFIYLAMRRYALFAISPGLAAPTVIETMPDSMIVTDLEGRIILLNDAAHRFFKVPKEAILGKQIESLFADRDKYLKLFEEVVINNRKIERYEAGLIDPLGEKIPSLINANKIRDALGSTLGIVYIIRDICG